jgi:hypothetical protein
MWPYRHLCINDRDLPHQSASRNQQRHRFQPHHAKALQALARHPPLLDADFPLAPNPPREVLELEPIVFPMREGDAALPL